MINAIHLAIQKLIVWIKLELTNQAMKTSIRHSTSWLSLWKCSALLVKIHLFQNLMRPWKKCLNLFSICLYSTFILINEQSESMTEKVLLKNLWEHEYKWIPTQIRNLTKKILLLNNCIDIFCPDILGTFN